MASGLLLPILGLLCACSAIVEAYVSAASSKVVSLDASQTDSRSPLMRRDLAAGEEAPNKHAAASSSDNDNDDDDDDDDAADHFDVVDGDDDEVEEKMQGKAMKRDHSVVQPDIQVGEHGEVDAKAVAAAVAQARAAQQADLAAKTNNNNNKKGSKKGKKANPLTNSPIDSTPTYAAKVQSEQAAQAVRDKEEASDPNGPVKRSGDDNSDDSSQSSNSNSNDDDVPDVSGPGPNTPQDNQTPPKTSSTGGVRNSSHPFQYNFHFHGPWFPERINWTAMHIYKEPVHQGLHIAKDFVKSIHDKATERRGDATGSTRGQGPEIVAPVVNGTARDTDLYQNTSTANGYEFEAANNTLSTLFVVLSSSKTKATSLSWLLSTWGSTVPRDNLLVISDKVDASSTHQTLESSCPTNSWTGDCCRWSEAVVVANRALKASKGSLSWAFFIKDSAYVRPFALSSQLMKTNRSFFSMGHALGDFACSTSTCRHGLCEGGGMAVDALGLSTVVNGDERAFLERHMHQCGSCGKWATLGLTELFKSYDIQRSPFSGTFPWRLSKACFDASLESADDRPYGPLMYNNISSSDQMTFMHELFVTGETPTTTVFPYPDAGDRCVTFETNYKCMKGAIWDTPWDPLNTTQDCNLMD